MSSLSCYVFSAFMNGVLSICVQEWHVHVGVQEWHTHVGVQE